MSYTEGENVWRRPLNALTGVSVSAVDAINRLVDMSRGVLISQRLIMYGAHSQSAESGMAATVSRTTREGREMPPMM